MTIWIAICFSYSHLLKMSLGLCFILLATVSVSANSLQFSETKTREEQLEEYIVSNCLEQIEQIYSQSSLTSSIGMEQKFMFDNYCDCILSSIKKDIGLENYALYLNALSNRRDLSNYSNVATQMVEIGKQCHFVFKDYLELNRRP